MAPFFSLFWGNTPCDGGKAPFVGSNFQILSVFLLGMVTGLLSFLGLGFLRSYREWTLSFLMGLIEVSKNLAMEKCPGKNND